MKDGRKLERIREKTEDCGRCRDRGRVKIVERWEKVGVRYGKKRVGCEKI